MEKVIIPISKLKREWLEVPSEFAQMVGPISGNMEPLFFYTNDGKRYIFEYYPKRNLLGGSALGEWYRNNVKKIRNPYQARIIIRLKSLEEMLFSIEIEKNSGSQTTDGLFLGKKYNMVGAKK